jgi:hypothetical protein
MYNRFKNIYFLFDSLILPGLIQNFCHIIIFQYRKFHGFIGLRGVQLGTLAFWIVNSRRFILVYTSCSSVVVGVMLLRNVA